MNLRLNANVLIEHLETKVIREQTQLRRRGVKGVSSARH